MDELEPELRDLYKKIHQTIYKVTNDIEDRFHFNTAISAVMELVNMLYGFPVDARLPAKTKLFRLAIESVVLLLSPVTPHISEEIWSELGNASVFTASWPEHCPEALVKDMLLVVVQINGKLRSKFSVAADADDAVIEQMALSDERVQKMINGKFIRKIVVVQKKLVNIVI